MGAGALEPDPPLLRALTKSQRRNQQHKRSRQKKTAARTHERQVGVPFVCVSTRLPWALGKAAASVEKQFGPSAVHGKSDRAADLLCKHLLALVHSDFSDRADANRTQGCLHFHQTRGRGGHHRTRQG